MPNYKLSTNMRDSIVQAAGALTIKYVDCIRQGFPLTPEEVQFALLEPELVAKCVEVEREVGGAMRTYIDVAVKLTRAQLPGLDRCVALHVDTPKHPMYLREHQGLYAGNTEYTSDCDKLMELSVERLSEDQRARLAKWCNDVVRAKRLERMADATVRNIMPYLTTTGRVLANWPILATLSKDAFIVKRFRAPPVRLAPYKLDLMFKGILKNPKQLAATEMLLSAAMMMDAMGKPEVSAHVVRYEKLDADPVF